ncbi:O-linked N-acetylglucosamine transferase, SPINDLY family protein [Chitinimonas naiadis]
MSPSELLSIARQRMQVADFQAADNFAGMILEQHPAYSPAWLLRAEMALTRGSREQVAAMLQQANTDSDEWGADFQLQLGKLWRAINVSDQAEQAYRRAVKLAPEHALAWQHLATSLQERGEPLAAGEAYRRALALDEGLPHAHNNYAILFQLAGNVDAALGHYRRAIELDPAYAVAWKNYASLLQEHGHAAEALTAYERAALCQPGYAEALAGAVHMRMQLLDWHGLESRQAALAQAMQADGGARISPFIHLGLSSDPLVQKQVAERWAAPYPADVVPRPQPVRPESSGRIRLGYLGGDFFAHATSWLTRGLFARHDRTRFEVIAYDYGRRDDSGVRAQIMADVDRFETVGHLDNAALAAHIRAAGIDILIDLKGWTRHSRTELLAQRLAPVQVHYLGYPGTLGAGWCDYLVADACVIPPGREPAYSEAIVRLPHCYQINDRTRTVDPAPGRAEVGLPEQGLVFCCFNQHYKLTPAMFEVWMQLLLAIPGSVLWLLAGASAGHARLRAYAERAGVSGDRLVFAPPLPQAAHLARLSLADLALDTLPCNSHTTASDALWAGVPLLTCSGDSFASRVAASCLAAVGLPELITGTPEAYLAMAIELGRNPDRLQALGRHLVSSRQTLPLFDTDATVHSLERAFLGMWQRHEQGQPVTGFDIPLAG